MAHRQPATWEMQVGTQVHPVVKKLYRTIVRADLLKLIEAFLAPVDEADKNDGCLECIGD